MRRMSGRSHEPLHRPARQSRHLRGRWARRSRPRARAVPGRASRRTRHQRRVSHRDRRRRMARNPPRRDRTGRARPHRRRRFDRSTRRRRGAPHGIRDRSRSASPPPARRRRTARRRHAQRRVRRRDRGGGERVGAGPLLRAGPARWARDLAWRLPRPRARPRRFHARQGDHVDRRHGLRAARRDP